jgi:beta-glucanase (GH16 family)
MHRARHSAIPRVIRTRPAVAFVVAAAGLATAIWLPSRFDNAEATESDRAASAEDRVVFEDTFDGDTLDRDKWTADTGSADGELQVFTDRSRNVKLNGEGALVITARRDSDGGFTSARLLTGETFAGAAGRVEARIKAADNQGIRSVFQLLGAENVDVMANFGDRSREVHAAIGDRKGSFAGDRSFADDFHTFSVDWAPGQVVWSVDGNEFFRTDETLDEPFTPSVALTVGGDEAGSPDDSTRFPQRMTVDLLRVTVRDDSAPEEPPASTPPTTEPTTLPTTPPTTPPTSAPAPPPVTTPAPPPVTTPPPAPAAKAWKPFTVYKAGDRVTYKTRTYEVREAHTSLPAWTPPAVPGLFKRV